MESSNNTLEHIIILNKIRYALINKVSKYRFCYDINFGVDTLNYLFLNVKNDNFITFTIKPVIDMIPKRPELKTKKININSQLEQLFMSHSLILCMNTFNSVYVNSEFIKNIFTIVHNKNITLIGCIYNTEYIDELMNNKFIYSSNHMKIYKKSPIFKISFSHNLCVGCLVENYAKILYRNDLIKIGKECNVNIEFYNVNDLVECELTPHMNIRSYFCASSRIVNNH